MRGIEEATEGDGYAGVHQRAKFRDELVLLFDPRLFGGRRQSEEPFAAYTGDGVAGDEGEERLPLQGSSVEMPDRGGDGIENRV